MDYTWIIIILARDCKYEGQSYNRGDIFNKGDKCNNCTCLEDGTVQCSEKDCSSGTVENHENWATKKS